MSSTLRNVLSYTLLATSLAFATMHAADTDKKSADAGDKQPFVLKRGDCEMTVGGKIKAEHYFQPRMNLLNKNIPDQNEFFKETVDLTFDVAYGKEKYGYNAAEFFIDLRHKGVWGKALSYADKDSGSIGPVSINLEDAIFGNHGHTNGKPMIWYKDAWLQFAWNAAFGLESDCLHTLKAGWFPFEMGRGIAMGANYGLNKELLGLYSYSEDKAAPGLLLHGDIIKDVLTYDLYYARFEERSKSFADSISMIKRHIVPLAKAGTPWRGINKNDDVIAGRLQWTAWNDDKVGKINVEPYAFYNSALDQKVDIGPDARTRWGAAGLSYEHAVKGFEFGGDLAFNYGREELYFIDKNVIQLKADTDVGSPTYGALRRQYSHILEKVPNRVFQSIPNGAGGAVTGATVVGLAVTTGDSPDNMGHTDVYRNAAVSNVTKHAAGKLDYTFAADGSYTGPGTGDVNAWTLSRNLDTNALIDPTVISGSIAIPAIPAHAADYNKFPEVPVDTYRSAKDRFRQPFTNQLRGWMGTIDMAYTFDTVDLKAAIAYGYASGDNDPHAVEKNKTYKGFIGLHEYYGGKRVPSVMFLGERLTARPVSLGKGTKKPKAKNDYSFSDLHMLGAGVTWTPKKMPYIKGLSINPNILGFFKAHQGYKFDTATSNASNTELVRRYMGTEFNVITKCTVVKDLTLFCNTGIFKPGPFYTDVKGVPLSSDEFATIEDDPRNDVEDATQFRLGDDLAGHINVGLEFKF